MIFYILLTVFAFIPFGAYLLAQRTQNKGLVLGFAFFYLLGSLYIFTGNFYKFNPHALIEVNKKIISKINNDEIIDISLYSKLDQYSKEDISKLWAQSYLVDALEKKHFQSAESIISIAESLYTEPDEKLVFYSMYTLLRDTRFPEFSAASFVISSTHPNECAETEVQVQLQIIDGPGVPIAEKVFNNVNEFSLSNADSLIPGFDIASALLNNESVEVFINLNCAPSNENYSFNSVFIFDPNNPINSYKINQNQWSKTKQ